MDVELRTGRVEPAESGGESQVTKLRVTVTAVVEYEPDPRHYPDCDGDPRRMLAVDLACAEEDPFLFLGNRQAEWTVSGEVELSEKAGGKHGL